MYRFSTIIMMIFGLVLQLTIGVQLSMAAFSKTYGVIAKPPYARSLVNRYTAQSGEACEVLCSRHPDICAAVSVSCLSERKFQCDVIASVPADPGFELQETSDAWIAYRTYPIPDHCRAKPCLNQGTCSQSPSGFLCQCHPGFAGVYCETNVDECAAGPCDNGGTCVDRVNGFFCLCPSGLVGESCDIDIKDECGSNPCQNNGVCNDGILSYDCMCASEFTGIHCETDIYNECGSNPCQNSGVCNDGIQSYTCTCGEGYIGVHCELGKLATTSCTQSSEYTRGINNYGCQRAIDSSLYSTWIPTESAGAWIKIIMSGEHTVVFIKYWPRCHNNSQFRRWTLEFSDATEQEWSRSCNGTSSNSDCNGVNGERYDLSPAKLTSFIKFTGNDDCGGSNYNGMREVQLYGY